MINDMKKYQKEWYLKNKEKANIRMKINYLNKRDEYIARSKKSYQKNKEKILKRHKEWREKNKEKAREYSRINNKKYQEKDRNRYLRLKKESYQRRKQYHWEDQLKRKYGITVKEYFDLLDFQKGLCAICEQPERYKNKKLAVDHCHTTGKVRGLLCFRCNATIGQFKDDTTLLYNAINYLNKHK